MPTLIQLKEAVTIAEQIEELQAKLASLVGGSGAVVSVPKAVSAAVSAPAAKSGKRTMSPEARARIAAAQRARWAKSKSVTKAPAVSSTKKTTKKRGQLSPEGRAKIVAALKARWAAKRAGKK
jgi:hypothetical protein